ncbi:MAG: hypothetical protein AB6733_12265 [Clostridiaceae bacterium]
MTNQEAIEELQVALNISRGLLVDATNEEVINRITKRILATELAIRALENNRG